MEQVQRLGGKEGGGGADGGETAEQVGGRLLGRQRAEQATRVSRSARLGGIRRRTSGPPTSKSERSEGPLLAKFKRRRRLSNVEGSSISCASSTIKSGRSPLPEAAASHWRSRLSGPATVGCFSSSAAAPTPNSSASRPSNSPPASREKRRGRRGPRARAPGYGPAGFSPCRTPRRSGPALAVFETIADPAQDRIPAR